MSKNLLLILKSSLFKVIAFVVLVFIFCKNQNLNNYYLFEGKVVGFDHVTIKKSYYRSRGAYIKMVIPKVEYYRAKDTVRCDVGETKMFTNFEINEKVVILENKENQYDTKLFTLFYYWIDFMEIVFLGLVITIIYGFIYVFIENKT
jgi:hypothetical protein